MVKLQLSFNACKLLNYTVCVLDMYLGGILSISEVNALTFEQFEEFEWLFRNVVECYPDIAQYVAHLRSFASVKNTKRYF